jgi:hypothetical protein
VREKVKSKKEKVKSKKEKVKSKKGKVLIYDHWLLPR